MTGPVTVALGGDPGADEWHRRALAGLGGAFRVVAGPAGAEVLLVDCGVPGWSDRLRERSDRTRVVVLSRPVAAVLPLVEGLTARSVRCVLDAPRPTLPGWAARAPGGRLPLAGAELLDLDIRLPAGDAHTALATQLAVARGLVPGLGALAPVELRPDGYSLVSHRADHDVLLTGGVDGDGPVLVLDAVGSAVRWSVTLGPRSTLVRHDPAGVRCDALPEVNDRRGLWEAVRAVLASGAPSPLDTLPVLQETAALLR
ncbi:hypothetical protein [Actinoalloteichus caeruleus]|uniref:Uncharacterized protein n=1 Tax=Actinoalloteichus caeruleus DSM 43889 TaxID=1120930 RepID=A0ABT1JEM2_ACTCY|nr:hypothetical protein [Actinoalloteichus caeruleus]MCP2330945.1 hypothetical protein [Actinoalloteichus caeruleus DSM 43889]